MDIKTIAVVAHDSKKQVLLDWMEEHYALLKGHKFIATGTTGSLVKQKFANIDIDIKLSGPLGGDQQVGALISTGKVDVLIFFTDPMTAMPHDVDVKALTRLAVVYNIPTACNRSSADFLVTSPFFVADYRISDNDYSQYLDRFEK
ncbi:MAG: methylglyoxal synthase [Alphaproteobacteria bacterium]|nr:methylglyoxal synthase [Alphaproteobacteria bacterium]